MLLARIDASLDVPRPGTEPLDGGVKVERRILPEVIETQRLVLRPFRLGDVDDVLAYAGDPEWARFLRDLPQPYGRPEVEEAVARQVVMDRVREPNWAIVLDGRVIGGVVLFIDFEHRSGELGYSVARRHWNRGLGTEAARSVLDAAFATHPELLRVWARTDPDNGASQRVLEKVGMLKEGVLRQGRVYGGEAFDEVYFSVLRSEWTG